MFSKRIFFFIGFSSTPPPPPPLPNIVFFFCDVVSVIRHEEVAVVTRRNSYYFTCNYNNSQTGSGERVYHSYRACSRRCTGSRTKILFIINVVAFGLGCSLVGRKPGVGRSRTPETTDSHGDVPY